MNQPNLTRANNFSLLRMLFASLVVLAHSFQMVYGSPLHDILFRIFGTMAFGDFSVDGFFIISGYLITQSFFSSSRASYLLKRVLRIYPGFIVAFLFSIFLYLYFSAYHSPITVKEIFLNVINVILAMQPLLKSAYAGSFYPGLNGPMWTISYEFHCYLMVILLAYVGLFRRKKLLLAITGMFLFVLLFYPTIYLPDSAHIMVVAPPVSMPARAWRDIMAVTLESPRSDLRLFGMFLSGCCFYIFRESIAYQSRLAAVAALMLAICMFFAPLAEPAVAIFGGYLIFWFAFAVKPLKASGFFNKTDLSYGIYLYAWPVQKVLMLKFHFASPYALFLCAWVLAALLACASWNLIEKPCIGLKSRYRPRAKPAPSLGV